MNQPQQLSVACDFQGFLVCQMPRDIMEVELKIKTKWGSSPSIQTNMQKQKRTGPGRWPAAAGSIPGGDYPAATDQMSTKAQLIQVLLLIVVKGWGIPQKHL